MRTPFWRSSTSGLTLIEVVAALFILGVLLVGVSLLRGRMLRQQADAERLQRAVAAADALLADWYVAADAPPVPADGRAGEFRWQTRSGRRVEVFDADAAALTLSAGGESVLTVPLIVPRGQS